MDQNNALEAKTSREETIISLPIDSEEVPPLLTIVSLQGQTSHMGTTIRTMENQMINAQISHCIESMELGLEMDFSTIKMGTGQNMDDFPVLHQLKREIFDKSYHAASQEVINLTISPSADLTMDLRLTSRLTNKNFSRTITRRHLTWFVSPQSTIPLTIYQTSVR